MTCQQLVELVTDYLEGALAPQDRARFEEHLAGCRNCQTYLAQMRVTIAALGGLREEQLSGAVREQLLSAFRGWKAGR